MTSDYADFDADRLTWLKDHNLGYRFCPRCGATLVLDSAEGHPRMSCPDRRCGFVFYQNPIPAAGAIIVQDDRILLVKRAHPPRVGWWCLPAGYMEWQESPRQCAVRELLEETALHVKLNELFDVYSGTDDPRSNAVLVLYLAEVVSGQPKAGDDALEVRFFGFDELPDQIAFEAHRQALADYRSRFLEAGR